MDYIITSEAVTDEERSSEGREVHENSRAGMEEGEQLAHDRLLQLLISTEHHLVHAF